MSELQQVENWLAKKLMKNADLRGIAADSKSHDHDGDMVENSVKIAKCRKWLANVRAVFELKPHND